MFTGKKVAQMAAVFTDRQGGTIYILKLIKLLYLADRQSIDQYGSPISYDRMVSMPEGPVLSRTLDLINGSVSGQDAEQWDAWLTDRENHQISLNKDIHRNLLDELSDADIGILETVWAEFGHMSRYEIRDYTHDNLDEWEDPNGSSLPIGNMAVLKALGKDDVEAAETVRRLRENDEISNLLAIV